MADTPLAPPDRLRHRRLALRIRVRYHLLERDEARIVHVLDRHGVTGILLLDGERLIGWVAERDDAAPVIPSHVTVIDLEGLAVELLEAT